MSVRLLTSDYRTVAELFEVGQSRIDCSGIKLSEARIITIGPNPTAEAFIRVHMGIEGLKNHFQMDAFFEVSVRYGLVVAVGHARRYCVQRMCVAQPCGFVK